MMIALFATSFIAFAASTYSFFATRTVQKLMESEDAAVERATKFETEAFDLRQSIAADKAIRSANARKGALVTNAKRKAAQ